MIAPVFMRLFVIFGVKKLAGLTIAVGTIGVILMGCGDRESLNSVNQNNKKEIDVVASVADLPKCAAEYAGEVLLVRDDGSFYGCSSQEWVRLDYSGSLDSVFVSGSDTFYVSSKDSLLASSVDSLYMPTVADYSCETTPLADGKGVVIYCGGDSIGVVYNGVKGEAGEKGEMGSPGAAGAVGSQGNRGAQGLKGEDGSAGADCIVASSTESTVTVQCGEDSFTMNLNMGCISSDVEPTPVENAVDNVDVMGFVQKGPFLYGSKVILYELTGDRILSQTNRTFGGNVSNDNGEYTVRDVSLVSGYARLEASGFYRNEITGKNSNSRITLKAYTDLVDRQKVNVNLLTHLESFRVSYLMNHGDEILDINKAKKQAQKEILASIFDVDASNYGFSEDLDIFGTGDGDASLLALSLMLQGNRNESELSALLTDIGQDIQMDGLWDGFISNSIKGWRDSIADWIFRMDLVDSLRYFRSYVESFGQGKIAPNFEKLIRKYYSKNLKLGLCGDSIAAGIVKNVSNAKSSYYAARYTSTANVGGRIRFVCADGDTLGNAYVGGPKWRVATDIEKDTFNLKHGLTTTHDQASVIKGLVNTSYVYVYENTGYRRGTPYDMSLGLNGCTAARRDSVASSNSVWYKCAVDAATKVGGVVVTQAWRKATTIEKDTLNWSRKGVSYVDGMIKRGNVTDTMYIYQKSQNQWRVATQYECDTHYFMNGLAWVDTVDGAYKKGEKSGEYYVFDAEGGGWRLSTSSLDYANGMDGCTKARAEDGYKARSIADTDHFVYNCMLTEGKYTWKREWNTFINDTFGVACPKIAGEIIDGAVFSQKYICDEDGFRAVNSVESFVGLGCISANIGAYITPSGKVSVYKCSESGWVFDKEKSVQKDGLVDSRDGKTYDIVEIGNQTWMAQNLSYDYNGASAQSSCPNNDAEACLKFGRLYTWAAVMDSAALFSTNGSGCGYDATCSTIQPVRGICPENWHVPTQGEWNSLIKFVETENSAPNTNAGVLLKSTTGWEKYGGNGVDLYGFSVFPVSNENLIHFWTSSESSSSSAFMYSFYGQSNYMYRMDKGGAIFVRCLKDAD